MPALVLLAWVQGGSAAPPRAPAEPTAAEPLAREQIEVQGLRRTVRFYRPASLPKRPALVMALHGSGGDGDGERFRALTDRAFEQVADRQGFLIAYPDAIGGHWNDCRRHAPYHAALAGIDDAAFLRAVTARAVEIAGGPLAGLFAVGYSNGGHLIFRLALEHADEFDALAVIAAHLPVANERNCRESRNPVSILLTSGRLDPVNPWQGGLVRSPDGEALGHVLSIHETIRYFRDLGFLHPSSRQMISRQGCPGRRHGPWILIVQRMLQ